MTGLAGVLLNSHVITSVVKDLGDSVLKYAHVKLVRDG